MAYVILKGRDGKLACFLENASWRAASSHVKARGKTMKEAWAKYRETEEDTMTNPLIEEAITETIASAPTTVAQTVTSTLRCPIIGYVKMEVEEFMSKPGSLANRIAENRTNKKHLRELSSGTQQTVAIGRYPDGRDVIIDGHSRKAAWAAGSLDRPPHVFVGIHQVESLEDEAYLIDIYCGRAAVATPGEKAEQARNRNGLVFTSELCNSSWVAAMKEAGYPKEDEGYQRFAEALKWLDQFGLSTKNTKRTFSAGIRAAFLETFLDYSRNAKTFWSDYVKEDSQLQLVRNLKDEINAQDSWSAATLKTFKRKAVDSVKGM